VDHVSFVIQRGETLGYLGPNGAGKSTTVKMIIGLLEPTSGEISLDGNNIHKDADARKAFQRRIGYVPEEPHLYPHLSGREYLQLVGRLRGMPRRTLESKMDQLLRLVGLWEDRHSSLAGYSKGMRQKVLLMAALLHDPEILILDEPFSGLDVNAAMILRSLLRAFAERGKMVLYSSHVLEVVEKICDKVLILSKGRVVAHDSVARLRERTDKASLEAVFAELTQTEDAVGTAARILEVVAA
jgi:ABC-2 type transport system ATP-binding protein